VRSTSRPAPRAPTRDPRARTSRGRRLAALLVSALLGGAGASAVAPGAGHAAGGDVERGRAVFAAAGGCTCHTDLPGEGEDAPWLAGGRALSTPFGTFYSTNITPDPDTGLGVQSEADFVRAMREGLAPDGSNYFPVFPYTSFTRMSTRDLRDLYAYLQTVPPVRRQNRPHDVGPPFSWRWAVSPWKWLHLEAGPYQPDPERDEAWNRGAYLVNGPAHCGECHTPRALSGGVDEALRFAGSADGPEGELAPNITPHRATGIGDWSVADMRWYLETGFKPDGDDTQGLMAELIEHGFSQLSNADREAIAVYLHSLPPIDNQPRGAAASGR